MVSKGIEGQKPSQLSQKSMWETTNQKGAKKNGRKSKSWQEEGKQKGQEEQNQKEIEVIMIKFVLMTVVKVLWVEFLNSLFKIWLILLYKK